VDIIKFDHGLEPRQQVICWFWDILHSFKFKFFVFNTLFNSIDLFSGHLSNSLTEFFQSIDERWGISNHSTDSLPSLLLVLAASRLQDHDCDSQGCDLVRRFGQGFEGSKLLTVYDIECLFSLYYLRLSILQDLISFSLLSLDLFDFNIQLLFFLDCSTLILLDVLLDDLDFSKQSLNFFSFSVDLFLFDL